MNSLQNDTIEFYNGYKMPVVGLGTWQATDEEINVAVDSALQAGYRHIDTAFYYENEAAIGNALKKWFLSGKLKREDVFIVTKLPSIGNRAESVEKYIKKSLAALQLDYVDLYLIHHPVGLEDVPDGGPTDVATITKNPKFDMQTDHESLWKAMEKQVDEGRAHSIGLSNFNARQIKRIVKSARIKPANLQVEVQLYFQQRELAAFCNALDITICAYGVLGSPGLSTFLTSTGTKITDFRELSPLKDPVVLNIAKQYNKTPAQVLLRHTIQRGIAVIPKSINPKRIKENFQVFDFVLKEEDMDKLNSLDMGTKGRIFMNEMMPGFQKHPEYPYYDRY